MKKETKELIEGLKLCLKEAMRDNDGLHWLNCKGNECFKQQCEWSERILKGEYHGCISQDNESNYNRLVALFDKFEEVEKQLAHGGFIKDSEGNLRKHGDSVIVTMHNGETSEGQLVFDDYKDCYKFGLAIGNEFFYFDEVKKWVGKE